MIATRQLPAACLRCTYWAGGNDTTKLCGNLLSTHYAAFTGRGDSCQEFVPEALRDYQSERDTPSVVAGARGVS